MEALQLDPSTDRAERIGDETNDDGSNERLARTDDGRQARTDDGRQASDGLGGDDSPSTRPAAKEDASEQLNSLSMDSIFDILSNPRRRSTIAYLNRNGGGPVQLRDLAEQIAAWENGVPVDHVTYKERKRVYTSLYQSHLDKMDRLGLLRYDRNRGTIEATSATGQLEEYLDSMTDDDRFRRYVPVGVAAVCVALVVGTWTGVLPLAPQNGFVVASVVASVFLAVAGICALTDH